MNKEETITPIGDQIIVKPIMEDKSTKAAIIIPDTVSSELSHKGTVVSLGSGKVLENGKKIDFIVKVGDTVIFKKYSPTGFILNEEEYLIMVESDILGIES